MLRIMKMTFIAIVFVSQIAYAGYIPNPETCDVTRASLTSVQNILVPSGNPSGVNLLSTSYHATACAGIYPGNDDAGSLSSPNPNIGQAGDGILNGEDILNGMEFIEPGDLQALDLDGIKNDPGWIHLAHFDAENNDVGFINYSDVGPSPLNDPFLTLDVADLLTLSLTCNSGSLSGCSNISWTLTPKLDIIDTVQELLGPANFDHLAFSVKAGNQNSGGGFAVYDFNFNTIFASENNPQLNLNTAYHLEGTLNTVDFGGKDISHLNVWARDPIDNTTRVPEPTSLVIFAIALLIGGYIRKGHNI